MLSADTHAQKGYAVAPGLEVGVGPISGLVYVRVSAWGYGHSGLPLSQLQVFEEVRRRFGAMPGMLLLDVGEQPSGALCAAADLAGYSVAVVSEYEAPSWLRPHSADYLLIENPTDLPAVAARSVHFIQGLIDDRSLDRAYAKRRDMTAPGVEWWLRFYDRAVMRDWLDGRRPLGWRAYLDDA